MTSDLSRPTTLFSVEKDGPAVLVYEDEVVDLITDAQLYGNVYVKADEHGVNVRIDPRSISSEWRNRG